MPGSMCGDDRPHPSEDFFNAPSMVAETEHRPPRLSRPTTLDLRQQRSDAIILRMEQFLVRADNRFNEENTMFSRLLIAVKDLEQSIGYINRTLNRIDRPIGNCSRRDMCRTIVATAENIVDVMKENLIEEDSYAVRPVRGARVKSRSTSRSRSGRRRARSQSARTSPSTPSRRSPGAHPRNSRSPSTDSDLPSLAGDSSRYNTPEEIEVSKGNSPVSVETKDDKAGCPMIGKAVTVSDSGHELKSPAHYAVASFFKTPACDGNHWPAGTGGGPWNPEQLVGGVTAGRGGDNIVALSNLTIIPPPSDNDTQLITDSD